MNSATRHLRVIMAAAAAFYSAFILRSLFDVHGVLHSTLFDDAMISMRYARNLAEGNGLVWNPGAPAVQGFTNPAWTLIMAAVHAAGAPPRLASLAIMILGAVLLLMLVAETFRLARLITDDDGVAVAAAGCTAFGYATVFWTLRGMEVGLLALLLTVAARAAIGYARNGRARDLYPFGAALVAALWTRPDALIPAVVLIGYLLWFAPRGRRGILVTGCVIAALGVAIPQILSRWYYGDALPNTYYLKLGGTSLTQRIGRGLASLLSVSARSLAPAFLAALPALVWPVTPRVRRELALLATLVAAQCAYSVSVGGDAWEWMGYANRYIATVTGFLAILAVAGVRTIVRRGAMALPAVIVIALIGLHLAVVVYLFRINRGLDITVDDIYHGNGRVVMSAVLVAAGILAFLWLAMARRSFAALCAVLWLSGNGMASSRWVLKNAAIVYADHNAAREGLLFRETLAPEATLALSWAGSIPYFAEHTTIDLLGKNDRVIARMAPVIPEFVPGHNKWNLRYSIGELRPDLACNLPRRPGEVEYLWSVGYRSIGASCFVRADARLDEARLRAGLSVLDPTPPVQRPAQ